MRGVRREVRGEGRMEVCPGGAARNVQRTTPDKTITLEAEGKPKVFHDLNNKQKLRDVF